jgi:predicted transcriptional regulator
VPVLAVAEPVDPTPRLADDDVVVALVPARATPGRGFRAEKVKPYEVPDGVEFNGDLLRQVRMARGLSMAQLAERTRIGARHLENVESDKYDALPATVYLRGILMNLARELGLDGLRVSKSYLAFVDAHRSKG